MDKQPFLSVIVLCYQVEKYLPQCLESIRRQSFGDFEVIMVDDGSPDGCGDICDIYAAMDSRFRAIHQENRGIIAARKAGINAARGLWCISVDGDDWVSLNMFEVMCGAITEYGVDYVQCEELQHYRDRNTRAPRTRPAGLFMGDDYTELMRHALTNCAVEVSLCRAMLKTDILREILNDLDESCGLCEDAVCVAIYAARAKSLYNASDELYHYRMRKNSCTTSLKSRDVGGLYQLCDYLEGKLADEPLGKPLMDMSAKYFIYHCIATFAYTSLNMGREEARRYWRESFDDERFQKIFRRFDKKQIPLLFREHEQSFLLRQRFSKKELQGGRKFLSDENLFP